MAITTQSGGGQDPNNFTLTLGAIQHDGEDVDEHREAVEEGQTLESWRDGIVLLQDEMVHREEDDGRDESRKQGGHEPGGH